jgi:hypothetical protein
MDIINAIPDELFSDPKPGVIALVSLWFLAPVLGPFDVRQFAEDVGFFTSDFLNERTDIHSHAIS